MRLLGGQVRAMRGSDLICSGHSATGTIGTALAGEVTAARLRVPGSPLGFRGGRRPPLSNAKDPGLGRDAKGRLPRADAIRGVDRVFRKEGGLARTAR